MIYAENTKSVALFVRALSSTANTVTVDVSGYDFAQFEVICDSAAATTCRLGAITLYEQDGAGASATFTGSTIAATSLTGIGTSPEVNLRVNVDCKARKNILAIDCKMSTVPTGYVAVVCHLSRGEISANNTTYANATNLVSI